MRVRLLCYNVRSFRADPERVAAAVASLQPDLVLLQECGSRSALRRFASAMGMEAVSGHRRFRRPRNAVVYPPSWRLAETEVHELSREGPLRRRGFIAAHLRRSGIRFCAVAGHLGLSARERKRHARELTDLLGGIDGHLVIGLDLNEGPESAAARWIGERFYDAFAVAGSGPGETFPAAAPTARIDFLFVRHGAEVTAAWVPDGSGFDELSDHRPVVAEVELPQP